MPLRRRSITIMVITFLMIFGFFYSRPWLSPQTLEFENFSGRVELTFETPSGERFTRIENLKDKEDHFIEIPSLKLVNIKFTDTETRFDLPEQESSRNKASILLTISLASFFFTFFLILFWNLLKMVYELQKDKKLWLAIILHASFLTILGLTSFPGFFNYDTFGNYLSAAILEPSVFSGVMYSLVWMVIYQVLPYPWTVLIFNLGLIFSVLTFMYVISYRLKIRWYYLFACLIFYAYPPHALMTISVTRDTFSHWFLLLTMLQIYLIFLKFYKNERGAKFAASILICCSCFLRQETVYYLPLGLLVLTYFFKKEFFKWSLATAVTCLFAFIVVNKTVLTSFGFTSISEAHYKTTVLISPLSYIVHKKYPDGLPPEINQRLGPYFKNDYLTKHFNIQDIDPYHMGGLNHEATYDDYLQFQRTTFSIIWNNLDLFMENRLITAGIMFGLREPRTYIWHDDYYQDETFFTKVRNNLGFTNFERPGWTNILRGYFHMALDVHTLLASSYLLIFLIYLAGFYFFRQATNFHILSALILLRTLLVVFTSPGGYFKYNYILWLFGLFLIPMALGESRTSVAHRSHEGDVPTLAD